MLSILGITIHSNTIIENTYTIHNILTIIHALFIIRTNIIFFLFLKFLPTRVR
jgi:hypothetical protein